MKNPLLINRLPLLLTAIVLIVMFFVHCSSSGSTDNSNTVAVVTEDVVSPPLATDDGTESVITPVAVTKASELTDANFQTTINSGVVLVDFWAAWCAPCRIQGPIVDEVAVEMGQRAKITKLNVDHFNNIATQYNVRNIPTIVLFKDGREVRRFVGVQSKDYLLQELNSIL